MPLDARAQDSAPPDSAQADAHDMSGMDHSSMPGMHRQPSEKSTAMDHAGMESQTTPAAHSMHGMTMGPMQGGKAPPNARSPDYSDGETHGPMMGMEMTDNASIGMLLIDQLEVFHGSAANGQAWEAEGWYGNDIDKLWLRTEGERSAGKLEDADLEAFWNRNVTAFWSTQLGLRHDFGEGPSRTWAAVGVQGMSAYWFELEATAYVGASGRSAARLRAEYELPLTQRLFLQPEAEVNLYGKNDPARRIGSGLSDLQFGVRLRYEIDRQFAPYIGVSWIRRIGATADFAREDFQSPLDRQVMAGVRLWF
jgi:copper resistance protein B